MTISKYHYLIACAILFLLSCNRDIETNSDETVKSLKSKIQINWVGQWAGEGDKEKLLYELANEYEFMHQDVKVNLVPRDSVYNTVKLNGAVYNEFNFLLEQLKKPVADWDIITRVHVNYNKIAAALNDPNWGEKYLVDFSKIPGFMESHYSFLQNDMYKKRFGNIIFGPYNEGQLAELFVNTEVAKMMGIKVKQYGMTFDDFLGYIKAANEYNKTHDYIAPIFEDAGWIHSAIIFKELFLSLMDNYQQVLDTRFTMEKFEAFKKCYEAFEELSKYQPVIKTRSQIVWARDNDYILNNKCLFFPNYSFMYSIWKMKGKDKLYKILPCELPVFKPSTTYISGYVANWAVLKNAPHRDEAIKLMMYWCKPAIAEKWVRYTKSPSGVKGSLTSTAFGNDVFENYIYMMEKKYGPNTIPEIDNQYFLGEKNVTVPIRVVEVLEGTLTADAAMKELKKIPIER